jgi:hypothetical protein
MWELVVEGMEDDTWLLKGLKGTKMYWRYFYGFIWVNALY